MRLLTLYVAGLEEHTDFLESQAELKKLVRAVNQSIDHVDYVTGNEDFKEVMASVKEASFPIVKKMSESAWTATKFLSKEGFNLAVKALNTSSLKIKKLSENNKYFLKEIVSQLPESHDVEVTLGNLAAITRDGKIGDFIRDIDEYKDVVNAMNKHGDAVLDYMNSIIVIVSKVSKTSTDKDVMSMLEKLDNLRYPKLSLENHLLPGGRTIEFSEKEGSVKYSMLTDKPSATSETKHYSKDEMKSILNKLVELNDSLLLIKKGQEKFIASMKTWNEKLPTIMGNLVDNTVLSSGAKSEIKAAVQLNPAIISFYGEIYPELGACVNSYIITLSGNFAKII
ncbi:hypothetical protein [Shewanella phage FishSpeaker]|nr:hypothetical protein [Shewanella phage FishSpeaker]